MREYIKGHSIMHDIDLETNGFFLPDGIHMTPIANDILLNTFQEAVQAFLKDPSLKLYDAASVWWPLNWGTNFILKFAVAVILAAIGGVSWWSVQYRVRVSITIFISRT